MSKIQIHNRKQLGFKGSNRLGGIIKRDEIKLLWGLTLIIGLSAVLQPNILSADTVVPALPSLHDPFTLVYIMTTTISEKGDDLLKQKYKGLSDSEVAQGLISRKQADAKVALYFHEVDKQNRTITQSIGISYDGHRTLYYGGNYSSNILIYDGSRSFSYNHLIGRASFYPGFAQSNLPGFIYPAASLPGTPILENESIAKRSGDTITLNGNALFIGSAGNDPKNPGSFIPTTVTAKCDSVSVKVLTLGQSYQGIPLRKITYSGHELFEGIWLPETITKTDYMMPPGTISTTTVYNLISASNSPLSPNRFLYESYLSNGLIVQDNVGTPAVAIWYKSSGGSLDKQISKERGEQILEAANLSNGRPPSRARSGLLAFIGLVFAGGAWVVWRRGSRQIA